MNEDRTEFSILLVEDNPDHLLLFKRGLQQYADLNARIDTAVSVQNAIEKLKQHVYHLLLVENKLRDEEGLELFEALKEEGLKIPFILMTPIRDDRLAKEAIRRGVADVIVENESHFDQLAEMLKKYYLDFRQSEKSHPKAPKVERAALREESLRPEIRDELTGVFTHSYMQDYVVREFARASRYGYPISCLLVDIDHFKGINEEKGYQVGDQLLKECAQLLFDSCRLSDLVARHTGTEFLVLLPHISYDGAFRVAKRLRLVFSEHVFLPDTEKVQITVSIGVSSYPEDAMQVRSDLINYARRALLHSKATGRNRTTLFCNLEPLTEVQFPKIEMSNDLITEFQRRISEATENARHDCLQASRDLLHMLENKDRFTAGHGANCAKLAKQMATAIGLSVEEAEVIENGALLHDIGKICIPDTILLKRGRLTNQEYEMMKQHTYFGYKILKPIRFLREESLIVLHHHEWFDGKGYPCHLSGEEIPLGARIVSIIDAYDTMRVAGGRYKRMMLVKEAVNELIRFSGAQFDPNLVKHFTDVLVMRNELTRNEYDHETLVQRLRDFPQHRQAA